MPFVSFAKFAVFVCLRMPFVSFVKFAVWLGGLPLLINNVKKWLKLLRMSKIWSKFVALFLDFAWQNVAQKLENKPY